MNKQVDKKHYNFERYSFEGRFVSYWHQLKEILFLDPKSILEIGVGDGVVANYIKCNSDIKYINLDIAKDLEPDIVASVLNMPVNDGSFDIVCAFEVLEHLPFEEFKNALLEMSRVSGKYVLISLPHWGRHFSLQIQLPFFKKIRWQHKFGIFPVQHKFDGQHYWEIGKRGYPVNKIKKSIKNSGLKIKSDYIIFNSPYHHIFILEK